MICFSAENLPEKELDEEIFRPAAGPGGQHLNKTSNGVRLTFDPENSAVFPGTAAERLRMLSGNSSGDGKIIITARESRSLSENRHAAREKLARLLNLAQITPKKRKKTKPSYSSRIQRRELKRRRSEIKRSRSGKDWE